MLCIAVWELLVHLSNVISVSGEQQERSTKITVVRADLAFSTWYCACNEHGPRQHTLVGKPMNVGWRCICRIVRCDLVTTTTTADDDDVYDEEVLYGWCS